MKAKPIKEPQRVTIAPGMTVPENFTLRASAAPGTPTLEMEFTAADWRVVCTRLELRGSLDAPVTAASLRLIRFDELTQIATDQNAVVMVGAVDFLEGIEGLTGRIARDIRTASRRRGGPDLTEVAKVYMSAGGGGAAMNDLRDVYGPMSEGTAWRLIRRAREAGHIPAEPLRRGPRPKKQGVKK